MKSTRLAPRIGIIGMAILIVALMSLVLYGCGGKSNEEIIREGAIAEFDAIKNLDDKTIEDALGDFTENADLREFGIDSIDFCRAWLEGFDYSIDDIVVEDSKATVTATIHCKSIESALNAWQEQLDELVDNESVYDLSTDALNKKIGSLLMECVDSAPMVTTTVELPYELKDKVWKPGSGFDAALGKAFTGELEL